ncbi:MAG: hypothetical protein AAF533_09680 [Acidobacteriota bacterium]
MSEDRYSEEEVAAILKRSAEIEGEQRQVESSDRLSLSEIERIAADSGLDPASVRAAAAEMTQAPATTSRAPKGLRLHHQRQVPVALDDSQVERLLLKVGEILGRQGLVSREGGGWRWRESEGGRRLQVAAASRSGVTALEITEDLRASAFFRHVGWMLGVSALTTVVGFAFGLTVEGTVAEAMVVALLGAVGGASSGLAIGHQGFRGARRERAAELERLVAELDEDARELAGDGGRVIDGTPLEADAEPLPLEGARSSDAAGEPARRGTRRRQRDRS